MTFLYKSALYDNRYNNRFYSDDATIEWEYYIS